MEGRGLQGGGGGAGGGVAVRARRLRGMWDDGGPQAKADAKQHDVIFNELMQECKHSAPGARLSARMRTMLERWVLSRASPNICGTIY